IDEDGFTYSFLSNGNGNQFNVGDDTNLYTNQAILIGSNAIPFQGRTIKIIQQISSSNWLVTVDGPATLGTFKFSDQAIMKAYLPNTVNSQKMIYIPVE